MAPSGSDDSAGWSLRGRKWYVASTTTWTDPSTRTSHSGDESAPAYSSIAPERTRRATSTNEHSASQSTYTNGPTTSQTASRTVVGAPQTAGASSSPAISHTHSPEPAAGTAGSGSGDHTPSSSSGLSRGAKQAVIASTVIGGTIVLALLLLLLFHRRRKAQNVHRLSSGRPPSVTTFLSAKTRDANLTALPIRRQQRNEVDEIPAPLPIRGPERFNVRNPSLLDVWKTANPPTPTSGRFSFRNASAGPASRLRPPETVQSSTHGLHRPVIRVSSHDDIYFDMAESIRIPSIPDLDNYSNLETPTSQQPLDSNRWSFTTSYATAKSRLDARSVSTRLSNLTGLRAMRDWIRAQSERQRQLNSIEKGDGTHTRANSVPFLKNKATKPNLAPWPARESSNRQGIRAESSLNDKSKMSQDEKEIENLDEVIPKDGVVS